MHFSFYVHGKQHHPYSIVIFKSLIIPYHPHIPNIVFLHHSDRRSKTIFFFDPLTSPSQNQAYHREVLEHMPPPPPPPPADIIRRPRLPALPLTNKPQMKKSPRREKGDRRSSSKHRYKVVQVV